MASKQLPTAPTQYNHFVALSVDGKPAAPYVFTTAGSADATTKLCALCFAEAEQKKAPVGALSHPIWCQFETEQAEAVDRKIDESRLIVTWDNLKRTAGVSRYVRTRDGFVRSGYATTTLLAEFSVGSVPRFISPLKVTQYFEARAVTAAAQKAAAEKKAAEEACAQMLAASNASVVSTAPVAAAAAPALVAAAPTPVPAPAVIPTPPPLPPAPTFDSVMGDFTQ